ncbi:hypothetical protein EU805_08290 [Salipiger sp. IMCC34102]|uniref:hypothetical protein n=1 Tax=Salipiger sp. IMCC34102 TaxID=2510647 RepID=UPI00101BCD9C|nr:hypothetical protein [Salipiger sp. IMCC34102]RYH02612.1 hypothetical protein EU805_08290 [Salipiger sp. IMCC34102]
MSFMGNMPNPGGATVGDLRGMSGDGALAILMYRDWFDGEMGRARVADVFVQAIPREASAAMSNWTTLMSELVTHARRPLVRHGLQCHCVGADEAVFAQLLNLASHGEREEAMLMLSLLMPADRTLCALQAAESCGCTLRRCALRMANTPPPNAKIH